MSDNTTPNLPDAWRQAARQNTYDTTPESLRIAFDALTDTAADAAVRVFAEALSVKLDDMQLYDDTGDPRDEGYMAALGEVRAWLRDAQGTTKEAAHG